MKLRGCLLLIAGLLFGGVLFSQAQKDREEKKLVDVKADSATSLPTEGKNVIAFVNNVVFHHNGAVISCDSAVRYSDQRIDCFRNVIINKDSTYVYGDRAEYNGDLNLARVYSPIVKVIDGDATLYTYNFSFNTLDNIGIYYGGGVMYQQDNVMESEKGYYYSDMREIVGVRNVEMKNNDYTIISDSVRYNMDTKVALFYTKTYIWTNEGEIITADKGRYNTQDSTYFFHGDAYVLTDFRETWADTIDFNAKRNDALLFGNVQIDDNEHSSSAFGDFGQYWGERGETMLTKRPSMFNFDEQHNNSDTLYMRADTIFMFVIYPSDRPKAEIEAEIDQYAHLRWTDSLPDSLRLAIADSLRPVITRMRTEADSLRRTADSIMDVLYPPIVPEIPVPIIDTMPPGDTIYAGFDTLAPPYIVPDEEEPIIENGGESIQEEPEPEQPSARRRSRNRGPNPDFWIYYPADSLSVILDSLIGVAPLPPMKMVTDSLSHMEKVRELLPSELSGQDASSLLDMLDGNVPEGMSHLVSDSIDIAALRNVIEDSTAPAQIEEPEREPEPEPEPEIKVPEKPEPPEVKAMRARVEELTSIADSLHTVETYIRPKEQLLPPYVMTAQDSLAMLAAADSAAFRARMDSLFVIDSIAYHHPKLYKRMEKAEKQRLKVERKAAKRAEKQRLRAEKRAEKEAKLAEKEAERRRKVNENLGWVTETALSDSLAMMDSLRMADSLMRLSIDSLELLPPEEPVSEADTTERIWRGWYDVRIWRKDMQAICDSIVGFSRDSTVRMYIDPILWHGENQIVADSLTLFTQGQNIDHAEFYGDPIMSSQISPKQFNQVKGHSMTSWFRDNAVYRHDVMGNAEAFYYIQEDDDPAPQAFIVATSDNMSFLIEDQLLRYVIARVNVEWPIYPIDQIPESQPTTLQGFKWHKDKQPELKDVFDRHIRPAEREFHEALERPKFPIAARVNRRREYLIENLMWADRVDPLPAHAVEYVNSLED